MRRPSIIAATLALGMAALFACDRRDEDRRTSGYRGDRDTPTTRSPDMTPPSGSHDQDFLTTAAKANFAEVELGGLAEKKAGDAEVKKFGQQMVEDHARVNNDVMDLAKKKGWTLPTSPDDAQKEKASKLSGLSGPEFDKKYAATMVASHEKSVALYEENVKNAKDPEVRAFAEKTLPKIQHHLKMARDLKDKVGEPTAD